MSRRRGREPSDCLAPPCPNVLCACVCQLEFSDDVARIIQAAINSDGGQPESRKANSMVKSYFIWVRAVLMGGLSARGRPPPESLQRGTINTYPVVISLASLIAVMSDGCSLASVRVAANGASVPVVQREGVPLLGTTESLCQVSISCIRVNARHSFHLVCACVVRPNNG